MDKYQESKWKLAKIVANLLKLNSIEVDSVNEDSLTTVVIEVKRKLQHNAIYQVLKSSGFTKDLEDPRAFYKNDHGYVIVVEYSDRINIRVVKGMIERFNADAEIDEFVSEYNKTPMHIDNSGGQSVEFENRDGYNLGLSILNKLGYTKFKGRVYNRGEIYVFVNVGGLSFDFRTSV